MPRLKELDGLTTWSNKELLEKYAELCGWAIEHGWLEPNDLPERARMMYDHLHAEFARRGRQLTLY